MSCFKFVTVTVLVSRCACYVLQRMRHQFLLALQNSPEDVAQSDEFVWPKLGGASSSRQFYKFLYLGVAVREETKALGKGPFL